MHDCYLNYETRFRKFRNLNKVWIDTGIEIYLFFSIDSSPGAQNKSNVALFYLAAGDWSKSINVEIWTYLRLHSLPQHKVK